LLNHKGVDISNKSCVDRGGLIDIILEWEVVGIGIVRIAFSEGVPE